MTRFVISFYISNFQYLIDTLEPNTINEYIKPSSPAWNSMEADSDLYEGSAEMFSSIQTASPVIFTSVSGDNLPDITGAAQLHSSLGKIFQGIFLPASFL